MHLLQFVAVFKAGKKKPEIFFGCCKIHSECMVIDTNNLSQSHHWSQCSKTAVLITVMPDGNSSTN